MSPIVYWVGGAALITLVALAVAWRPLRTLGRDFAAAHAREAFTLERERLHDQFLEAANQTGKPRGLRWTNCEFGDGYELARDRHTGQLIALVPVAISFAAIEGGPMEGVEAVGNLRNATAVFAFARGHWTTAGKAVFNLNPDETLTHFKGQYERVEKH
jgi:hypothetical protein